MASKKHDGELVTFGAYLKPAEAEVFAEALRENGVNAMVVGDSLANDLSYIGTAIGGARVLVPADSADLAAAIYQSHRDAEPQKADSAFPEGFDFGDDTPDEPDPPSQRTEASGGLSGEEHEMLTQRAYRAAIVGLFTAPLFVGLYSMWLIVRYRLWNNNGDGAWRLYVALACNLVSFYLATLFWFEPSGFF